MATSLCPRGHAVLNPAARFCQQCGAPLGIPAFGPLEAVCALHADRPAQGTCPRCGTFACDECLRRDPVGAPICATCLERELAQPLPWDQRQELGLIRAYLRTCMDVMLSPMRTLARAKPTGSWGDSLLFALLSTTVGFVPSILVFGVLVLVTGLAADSSAKGLSPAQSAALALAAMAIFAAVALPVSIAATILMALLDHAVLLMVRAKPQSFQITLRAWALSTASYVTGLLPVVGPYLIFPIWSLVTRVMTYRTLHRLSWPKAVVGALAVPVVLTALGITTYVAMVLWILSMRGGS